MPGMIFHMMIYTGTGNNPILAVLNDAAGITGCLRWNQTHDREIFQQFSGYLLENGAVDIYGGMKNHLKVDELMHGSNSPVYPCMVAAEWRLRKEQSLFTSEDNYTRMAELVAETGLDGVVREENRGLFDIIGQSQQELDLERVSYLFAGFYHIDEKKLREGLEFLNEIDFNEVASMNGLARAWLSTYKTAMRNLSEFEEPGIFKPWYDYLARCFTDSDSLGRLGEIEGEIKPELRESYELSMNLDFRDG